METIFITKRFYQIDKSKWPPYVKDFVENPNISRLSSYVSKIYFVKFNTEAFPRILFFQEKRGDYVLYIPRVYFKKHEEYDEAIKLQEKQLLKKYHYDDSEVDELECKFKELQAPLTKDKLPLEMRDFEGKRDFSNISTSYVYEMEEWVNHIKSSDFEDDKREIHKILIDLIVNKQYPEPDDNGWITLKIIGGKELVCRVESINGHFYFYLFDIAKHNIDKYSLYNKYQLGNATSEDIHKQARKGYPDWIMYGEFEDWKKLENDDEANLALSAEEIEVLNNTKYPYFINGLAGSGKSTILYYLFAHAYTHQPNKCKDFVFISYSKKLVKKAQVIVKALLNTNPSYAQNGKLTDEEEKKLEACFLPFQDFLKNRFLSTEDEFNRFSQSKHIDYEKFKKKYKGECKLPEADQYSAAIVWSIIRSYIKGRKYNSFFTINDYVSVSRSDKIVNANDFDAIYKIWKNWYKQYENDFWDDLDLIRYILKKLETQPVSGYDIIYCDEAQDFTPIENQLIIKLSKYSKYDLEKFENIPIAYAGDPNQTVNPTGFSWSRLSDVFNKSFKEQINSYISLRNKTLNNNYRSKRTIVEFANSIQYIRKHFLTEDPLQPQEQWNPQENAKPGFFFIDSDSDKEFILKGFEKAECIITGADGEYEKELDGNELTSESTLIEDDLLNRIDNKTKLYTAISSKGLEFRAVLLYKFAESLPSSFDKILNYQQVDEADKYELSHFFTKLYIAVSRAKELLYIIDTKDNYDRFWKYFVDNIFCEKLMQLKGDSTTWCKKIGGISVGDKNQYMLRLEENFNPLELAEKIYEDAKLSQDPQEMNRAAGYFAEANKINESNECKAYVYLYEMKYFEAGEKFRALNKPKEATEAYWKGKCWPELLGYADRAEYKIISQYMTKQLKLVDLINNDEIIVRFNSADETWREVAFEIKKDSRLIQKEYFFNVCKFLEKLQQRGFPDLKSSIANLYFKIGEYKSAVRYWEELGETEHPDFYMSKEKTTESTSEVIYWKHKRRKNSEIISQYGNPEDINNLYLDERAQGIIFSILLDNNYEKAIAYPYPSDDISKWKRLYESDKLKFLSHVVLPDFTEEKFYFLKDKADIEYGVFDDNITREIFDKVFDLDGKDSSNRPYWTYFITDFKNSSGDKILKRSNYSLKILESVSSKIESSDKIDKTKASCFLEYLFDKDYDYARTNNFRSTLVTIFSKDIFSKYDFRQNAKNNKYFTTYAQFKDTDYDNIKDHVRDYVNYYIKSSGVKGKSEDEIKALCVAYEVCCMFDNRKPNYKSISEFYRSCIKSNLKDSVKSLLEKRMIFNQFLGSDNMSFDNLVRTFKDKDYSFDTFVSTFSKEDAIMFISRILGVRNNYHFESTLLSSKLIYKFRLRKESFKNYCGSLVVNNINMAIKELNGDKQRAENYDYLIKLLSFTWEMICDKKDTLNYYEGLIKEYFPKATGVGEYLRKRVLRYYSYMEHKIFQQKQEQYGIRISKDALPEFPIIEKRTSQTKSLPIDSILRDPKKEGQLEMAKKLKKLGVPIDTIIQSTTGISKEEIQNL